MVRAERTGWRDEWYSKWHRERLSEDFGGGHCYLEDMDWLEYGFHKGQIVILWHYELKCVHNGHCSEPTVSQWQLCELLNAVGIPSSVVWYDNSDFSVPVFYEKNKRGGTRLMYNEAEWSQKILSLHSEDNIYVQYIKQSVLMSMTSTLRQWWSILGGPSDEEATVSLN